MDAGAAPFPDRGPRWRPRRGRLALALSVGLHLLAALWLQQRRPPPAPSGAPQAISILLQPPAARPRPVPAPAPAPVPVRAPAPVDEPPPRAPKRATPQAGHAATPAPAPVATRPPPASTPPAGAAPSPSPSASPASIPSAASVPDTLAVPRPTPDAAALARDPAASANGSFTLGLAKREAGRIDRELRGGKSGVPTEADTPWARFQRGLEAAHVDNSRDVIEDSYTSPDGVVIYRWRSGGRAVCRQTGSVGLGVAGTHVSGNAGSVACPAGVTWHRED